MRESLRKEIDIKQFLQTRPQNWLSGKKEVIEKKKMKVHLKKD